jgi:hypothetical protein
MCIQDNYGIKTKPNTSHNPTANAIIERERVHKVVNDMLRSFDLENNHEHLEEQDDNLFDYFLQSNVWFSIYQKNLSYNTVGNIIPTCIWQ